MKRNLLFLSIVFLLMVPAFLAFPMGGSSRANTASDDVGQELDVSRIVLFSTGVGYYQRTGVVENNQSIDLRFKLKDINDLLKSMMLQDFDGGSISSVNYSSREPLNVSLRSMFIDLSGNPGITAILQQLRGEEIHVDIADGGGTARGTVVGVQNDSVLNLYGRNGIFSVEVARIQAIRFADPYLDNEFRKALRLLTDAKSADEKRVSFEFKGEGARRILVGYLLEAPVWKTTYRLILGEDGTHALQGWAIVENTTDEDWTNIDLSLVSGRPVSFTMDLYSPIYNKRPTIQIETASAVAPQEYDAAPRMSKSYEAPRPSAAMSGGAMAEGFADFDDFEVELAVNRGVESAAATSRSGEFFHYAIEHPVSLPRKESAMVPIVNEFIEGERISIFNPDTGLKHPFNGIRLTNTTDIDLMGGPLTVFEAGTYAGDSQIGSVFSGDERILSYSLDLNTEVKTENRRLPGKIVEVAIEKGILSTSILHRQETAFSVTGRGLRERKVVLEHRLIHGWDLVEPSEADEKTNTVYRFSTVLPKSGNGEATGSDVLVAFELTEEQKNDLLSVNDSFLQNYIESDSIPLPVKTSMRGILDRRGQIATTASLRRTKENRRTSIVRDQDRIRRNMENLDNETDLYKQYVDTLAAQESELGEILITIGLLNEQERSQRNALEEYVRSLQTR